MKKLKELEDYIYYDYFGALCKLIVDENNYISINGISLVSPSDFYHNYLMYKRPEFAYRNPAIIEFFNLHFPEYVI